MQQAVELGTGVSVGWEANRDRFVATLAALGHKHRLKLWFMLAAYKKQGLAAGEIAVRLAIPASSLSFHLQQMTQAGLLKQRRYSRQMIYSVNEAIVRDLCWFLLRCTDDGVKDTRPYHLLVTVPVQGIHSEE